jgi:hypothetical protein
VNTPDALQQASSSETVEVDIFDSDGNLIGFEFVTFTDPIILNLTGGSVQTTALDQSSTFFDVGNNGQRVQTAWATAGEGLLVYDPNSKGAVTQESDLVQGFPQLAALDANHDGKLDASDPAFSQLKVWVDKTGSGAFSSGSLYTLAQLGITAIDLNPTQVNKNNNGNTILVDGTFTRKDGSTGDIAGVNLLSNPSVVAPSDQAMHTQLTSLAQGMASFHSALGSPVPLSAVQPPPDMAIHSAIASAMRH